MHKTVFASLFAIVVSGLGYLAYSIPAVRQFAAGVVLGPSVKTSEASKWLPLDTDLSSHVRIAAETLCTGAGNSQDDMFGYSSHLSDLRGLDLMVTAAPATEIILQKTEGWETGSGTVPGYPAVIVDHTTDDDTVRMFYSVHDAPAGIGLANSESILGQFEKVAVTNLFWADSRILKAPRRPVGTSHFSSPSVVWDEDARLWRLYFHYYASEVARGFGHQKTTVASTHDLGGADWEIHSDESGNYIATHLVDPDWGASQSSYHVVARIGQNAWVSLMRGTNTKKDSLGVETPYETSIAIAISYDGLQWSRLTDKPIDRNQLSEGVLQPVNIACTSDGILSLIWYNRPSSEDGSGYLLAAPLANPFDSTKILPGLELTETSASIFRSKNSVVIFHGNRRDTLELPPTNAN